VEEEMLVVDEGDAFLALQQRQALGSTHAHYERINLVRVDKVRAIAHQPEYDGLVRAVTTSGSGQ